MEKSKLFLVGRVSNAKVLVDELGYKMGNLPTTYLGLPLGAHCKSLTIRDGMEEHFRKKLALWKRQYISKGGRITLIKSTLSSLPLCLMSILPLPRMVRLRLDQVQRNFLWGEGALVQKLHLVKWDTICLERRNGGLGVKNLSIMNKALLCKWSWQFANEKGAWLIEVIRRKYGEEEVQWVSCNPKEGFGVGLWKNLRQWGYLVSNGFSYVVGDGKRMKFWKDRWCGDLPLDVAFSSLFSRAMAKEAWVGDSWSFKYGGGCWNPIFYRSLNEWEMEDVESFLGRIGERRVIEGVKDIVRWTGAKNGIFPLSLCTVCYSKDLSSLFLGSVYGRIVSNQRCLSLFGRLLRERS